MTTDTQHIRDPVARIAAIAKRELAKRAERERLAAEKRRAEAERLPRRGLRVVPPPLMRADPSAWEDHDPPF